MCSGRKEKKVLCQWARYKDSLYPEGALWQWGLMATMLMACRICACALVWDYHIFNAQVPGTLQQLHKLHILHASATANSMKHTW